MRRNEKKHLRPAERLSAQPALPLPGRPIVEDAVPGRLLVLMSQLHRRERPASESPPGVGGDRDPGMQAWPCGHKTGKTAGIA